MKRPLSEKAMPKHNRKNQQPKRKKQRAIDKENGVPEERVDVATSEGKKVYKVSAAKLIAGARAKLKLMTHSLR